jgi:peptide/nickel transport system permease protein
MKIGMKLGVLALTVFLVSLTTFMLTLLLKGDPVVAVLGTSYDNKTPTGLAQIETVRKELRLDRAVPMRYLLWAKGVATGDLGHKVAPSSGKIPTTRILKERLPVTLEIMILTQIVAVLIAVPMGVMSAYRKGKPTDSAITGASFILLALPNFALALILVFVFSVKLKWLPSVGYTRLTEDLGKNLRSMVIPVLTLALGLASVYTRLLRSEMSATLQEDFIQMATAKGIKPWRVLLGHALRPSSFSLLTVIGINIGALIGGAVIMEQLMSINGVGSALVESILSREYQVVLGLVLVITLFYVTANFVVDLLYSVLDPRIRRGSTRG